MPRFSSDGPSATFCSLLFCRVAVVQEVVGSPPEIEDQLHSLVRHEVLAREKDIQVVWCRFDLSAGQRYAR